MEVESIPVEGIRCGNRLRAVSPERVEALAASMAALGLRTPISVRIVSEFTDADGSIADDVPILIAGLHRVEAAKRLGWDYIDAFVLEGDERDFRLWEIAENLHRAELTVQERAEHIAEWVRITGEKVSAKLAETPHPKGGRPGSIDAARKELGISEGEARRAVKIASLSPEAKEAARETGRDNNQSALMKAAKAPLEEQARVIREYEPAPRVKPAPAPLNDIETEETWMAGIMRFWNRAAPQWREHFMERVDTPTFDNAGAGRAA